MKIGAICTRKVVVTCRETPLGEAAMLMRENHVGSVVILDQGMGRKPAGILTDRDIVVEVVAAGLDPGTVTVGDVMSISPATACERDDVLDTLASMRRRGVRRLPVVDGDGNLSGIVTMDDIVAVAGHAMADIVDAIASERSVERVRRP